MFGRRNPDQSPNSMPAAPPSASDNDMDLDLMPDLPAIPPAARPDPAPEPPPTDPVWHASTLPLPNPAPWEAPAPPPQPTPAMPTMPAVPPTMPAMPTTPAEPPAPALASAVPPLPVFRPPQHAPGASVAADSASQARAKPISESVIGPDDFFDGRYRSERGVRIQGNARGSIESRQYIFVEGGATVEADLSAEDITVAGSFNGKIECRRRLEVTSTGRIQGQVTTTLLVVQEGGLVDGELHMHRDEAQPEQQ